MSFDKSIAYKENFILTIDRNPNISYFCQQPTLPSVSIDEVPIDMGRATYKEVGGNMVFDPLNVTFQVDENFTNYKEIFDWMLELRHPEAGNVGVQTTSSDIKSQLTLTVLNNNKIPIRRVHFIHAWPTNLSEVQFDVTTAGNEPQLCDVSFTYTYFEIETITNS